MISGSENQWLTGFGDEKEIICNKRTRNYKTNEKQFLLQLINRKIKKKNFKMGKGFELAFLPRRYIKYMKRSPTPLLTGERQIVLVCSEYHNNITN